MHMNQYAPAEPQEVLTVEGWILTMDGKQRFVKLHAIMHVATCDMRLLGCVCAQNGHHMPHVEAVTDTN